MVKADEKEEEGPGESHVTVSGGEREGKEMLLMSSRTVQLKPGISKPD